MSNLEYFNKFDFGIDLLSKYRQPLMGMAIIAVLLGHFVKWIQAPESIIHLTSFFVRLVFTEGFLLLSGYGLYYSFKKDNCMSRFYKRRIERLVIPYILIAIPFVVSIYLIDGNLNLWQCLGWITSIGYFFPFPVQVVNMWYIALSVILYFIFPFLFLFMFKTKFRPVISFSILVILCIVLNIFIYIYSNDYWQKVELAIPKTLMFVIGIYWGYLAFTKKSRYNIVIWCTAIAILYLIISLLSKYTKDIIINGNALGICIMQYLSMVNKLAYIPLICFLFKWALNREALYKLTSKLIAFFNWFGKYTLELYVLHLMIKRLLASATPDLSITYIAIIAVSASIVLCMPVHYLTIKVSDKIMNARLIPKRVNDLD